MLGETCICHKCLRVIFPKGITFICRTNFNLWRKKKPSFAEQVLNYCLKNCCLPFTALQAVQKPGMPPPRSAASLGSKKSQTAEVLGQRGSACALTPSTTTEQRSRGCCGRLSGRHWAGITIHTGQLPLSNQRPNCFLRPWVTLSWGAQPASALFLFSSSSSSPLVPYTERHSDTH